MKKLVRLYLLSLATAFALGGLIIRWPFFLPAASVLLGALIWIFSRNIKKSSTTGKTASLINSMAVPLAGSAGRLIGDVRSFLEDIKARGFEPRGILDIGANRGDWTKMALDIYPFARSVLVEPQHEMESFLKPLCASDPRCSFFKCGAGREEGELVLTIWEDSYGSSYTVPKDEKMMKEGKQRITPIRTVDGILHELGPSFIPDLVKVDVQGYELEVLSGANGLFGETEIFILETTLLVEENSVWPCTRRVIEFMGQKGYEIYDLTSFLRKPSDGSLGQLDFAFVKAKGRFRQNFAW